MSILATSVPVTDNKGEEVVLENISCIHYLVQFQEGQKQIRVLLNSGSKVNVMSFAYTKRLGLKTRKTNVKVQKIDGSALKTFGMMIVDFQVENKGGRPRFFQKIFLQKTFLMANTKFEVIIRMPFLKLNNADVSFGERTLTWKSYTTSEALLTIK